MKTPSVLAFERKLDPSDALLPPGNGMIGPGSGHLSSFMKNLCAARFPTACRPGLRIRPS